MKFYLIRTTETENQANGILLIIVENKILFIGQTIENRNTIFRQGLYNIKWEYSPKFQQDLWELKGIEGRSEIKIHQGNRWTQSLGCILLKKEQLIEFHRITSLIKRTTIKII